MYGAGHLTRWVGANRGEQLVPIGDASMSLGYPRGFLATVGERCREDGECPWIERFIRFVDGSAVLADLMNEVYWVTLCDMNRYAAALPQYPARGSAFTVSVVHCRGQIERMVFQRRTLRRDAPCIWYPDALRVVWASAVKPIIGTVSPNAFDRYAPSNSDISKIKSVSE